MSFKSKLCNVSSLTRQEMYKLGEEVADCGGYFIIKGFQKYIRMLVMPRRNYVILFTGVTLDNF